MRVVEPDPGAAHDVQRLFVEQFGTGAHQSPPARQVDGARRRGAAASRDGIRGRGTGGIVPHLRQRLAAGLQQQLQRTRGTRRRPIEHSRAAGVVPLSPGVHQNRDGVARRDEIEKHLHLGGLQRLALRIAVQHRRQRVDRREIIGEQLRHGHRGLEHHGRVNHVAEIQDPADCAGLHIDQQVVPVTIAMNRLAAQRAQCRHALLERGGHPLDRFAQIDRHDAGREFNELRKAAYVPRQTLRQRRMEKPPQRAVEAREHQPKIVQQGRGGRALRQQLPRQITHETDRVAAARGLDAADVRARLGRKHARHRKRRVLLGQVAQHADLTVRRFGAGVEDR